MRDSQDADDARRRLKERGAESVGKAIFAVTMLAAFVAPFAMPESAWGFVSGLITALVVAAIVAQMQ